MPLPATTPGTAPPTTPRRARSLATTSALALVFALLAWADARTGWVETAFDGVAHLAYELPAVAAVRRPSQIPLVRAHLAVLGVAGVALAALAPWVPRPTLRFWQVILVAYAVRAGCWVTGGNVPLVPGDSCHYLEVAASVYRGEGAVKHYVESFFRDYPAIRQNRGVLDDWATPLYAYTLALAYRLTGVVPLENLSSTVAVAKGVSFAASLLTLPALYGFARRRFGPEVALGAAALLAVFPVHAIYAGFALRESLVGLTSVLAVWAMTEVWSANTARRAWGWAFAAGLAAGLAVLARNTAMALVAGAGSYGLATHFRKAAAPLLFGGAVALLVVSPWAWTTRVEYGTPFYTYTGYFPYNFSWTVHHYEKGNTLPGQFYTKANAPEIVRIKLKAMAVIAWTSVMVVGLPVALAAAYRVRRGNGTDRLVAWLFAVFGVATLVNVADVTQVAQLGRYYMPVFVLLLPSAVAGFRDMAALWSVDPRALRFAALGLVALLWADPTWAYDAGWFGKPYQLHWPAITEVGDWVKAHPGDVPPDARVMTWFPWEVRVASDRTTVLMPRNYSLRRADEVIRQYGVTHVLWGSFEPPEHVDPEAWGPYLGRLRAGLGLTDARLLHASAPGTPYPVRLYRVSP